MENEQFEMKDPMLRGQEKQRNHLDPDLVMSGMGKFARYQILAVFLTNSSWYMFAVQVLSLAFMSATPPFLCNNNANSSFVFDLHNDSMYSKTCSFGEKNQTEQCTHKSHFAYEPDFGETLASEFSLICDTSHYAQLGTSVFMIGTMAATLFISQISDRYGRRWPFMISCWSTAILGFLSAFSPSHTVFLIIRFLMGVSTVGVQVVAWVYSLEIVAPEFRGLMPMIGNSLWTISYCIIGVVAIYVKDWRTFTIVLHVPMVFSAVYYWLLPESLYWLVAKEKTDDALKWIERGKRLNKAHFNVRDCYVSKPIEDTDTKKRRHLGHVFKDFTLTFHTILFCYIAITVAMVYWALSLMSTRLGKDRYTGFILSGLIEFPAGVIGPLLLIWFGRRTIGFWSFFVQGTALVAIVFLPSSVPSIVTMILNLAAKFGNIIIWCSSYLLLPEMLPTTVRNVTYGFIATIAKLGSIVSPYAAVLADVDERLPPAVFGVMSLIAAAIHFLFPETSGKELPEDIEDTDPGPFLNFVRHRFKR